MALKSVTKAQVIEPFKVQVTFSDGVDKTVDLAPHRSGAVFEPLRDPAYFRKVFVEDGTIRWPNGADFDPEVLYYGGAPPWALGERAAV